MVAFTLESSREGGFLTIEREERPTAKWWYVTVETGGLRAATRTDGDPMGIAESIGRFFKSLGEDWRGWDGERTWSSIEGTFALNATHDGLGHVPLRVHLQQNVYEHAWQVDAVIHLEAGGLPAVAREALRFDPYGG